MARALTSVERDWCPDMKQFKKMSEQKMPSLLGNDILWAQGSVRGSREVKGNSASGHWPIAGRELWDELFSLLLWKAWGSEFRGKISQRKRFKKIFGKQRILSGRESREANASKTASSKKRHTAMRMSRALACPPRPAVWTGRLEGLKKQGDTWITLACFASLPSFF